MDNFKGLTNPTIYNDLNQLTFIINRFLSQVQTATLVRIESCTNDGGLSPVGFVNVTPLVNDVTSKNEPLEHATIFNVPYMRLQGGSNAIILDPQVGDIGLCVFASKDITKVKSTKDRAMPDSERSHHYSDGLYVGGMLNGTPAQFVQFSSGGITITSPNVVTINASSAVVNAPLTVNGTITATGTITAPIVNGTTNVLMGGISGKTHTHGGVQTGTDNTGVPQ